VGLKKQPAYEFSGPARDGYDRLSQCRMISFYRGMLHVLGGSYEDVEIQLLTESRRFILYAKGRNNLSFEAFSWQTVI
jgi:hypothetical protein